MTGLDFRLSRVAKGDQTLGFPFSREAQVLPYQFRHEERRTHPAGTEAKGVGGQQQVLPGHGRTLCRHDPLVSPSPFIWIRIHILHAETNDDHYRGACNPLIGTMDVLFNHRIGHAVCLQVGAEAASHRCSQTVFRLLPPQDGKAPWLPVVGRGGPIGSFKNLLDEGLRNRLWAVTPDRTPGAEKRKKSVHSGEMGGRRPVGGRRCTDYSTPTIDCRRQRRRSAC